MLTEALEDQPNIGAVTELHRTAPEGFAAMDRLELSLADIDVDQGMQALDRAIRSKAVA